MISLTNASLKIYGSVPSYQTKLRFRLFLLAC